MESGRVVPEFFGSLGPNRGHGPGRTCGTERASGACSWVVLALEAPGEVWDQGLGQKVLSPAAPAQLAPGNGFNRPLLNV